MIYPNVQRVRLLFYLFLLFRAAWRAGVAIFLPVIAIAQLSALRADPAQGAGQQAPGVDAVARPCKSNPSGSKPSKGANKNGKKKLNDAGATVANACLEVHSTALEIQEYLQVYGREQKWSISDEHVGDDSWTLYRNLDKGESRWLLSFGGLRQTSDRKLEHAIGVARQQAALSKRILFLTRTQQVFRLWHVIHRPFSYAFAILAALHIGIALFMGYRL